MLALYGLAMHHAQCVERETAILVATLANPDFLTALPEENNRSFETQFSKTLRPLIQALSVRVKLPADLGERLQEALRVRNWLAHRYFWERAASILTHEGRRRMLSELEEAADFLNAVDDELTVIAEAWRECVGIPSQITELEIQRYLQGQDR